LREQVGARNRLSRVDAQYDKLISIGVLKHAGGQLAEVIKPMPISSKPGLGLLHLSAIQACRAVHPQARVSGG
jgi:hypothetical protein